MAVNMFVECPKKTLCSCCSVLFLFIVQSTEAASSKPDVTQSDVGLAPFRKTASSSDSVTGEIIIDYSPESSGIINQVQQVPGIPGPDVSDSINQVHQVQNMPEASDTINQEQHVQDIPEEDEVISFLQSIAAWEGSTGQSLQHDSHTLAPREDTSMFAPSNKINVSKRSTYGTCEVAICHHSADWKVMLKIKRKCVHRCLCRLKFDDVYETMA